MFTSRDWMLALRQGFPIWAITAVLCVGTYYGYKAWTTRKTS
jgi:hypothetical protein